METLVLTPPADAANQRCSISSQAKAGVAAIKSVFLFLQPHIKQVAETVQVFSQH